MPNLIRTENFANQFSENLISDKSLFNETPTISYSGDGSVIISELYAFANNSKSAHLNTNWSATIGLNEVFSFGDALITIAPKDGVYIFSFEILNKTNPTVGLNGSLFIDVYFNGILEHTFENAMDFNDLGNDELYVNFNCGFEAVEGTEINYAFRFEGDYPGFVVPTLNYYLSGFKVEVDDRNLNIPTPFSYPSIMPIEGESSFTLLETTRTINDSRLKVGDRIQVIPIGMVINEVLWSDQVTIDGQVTINRVVINVGLGVTSGLNFYWKKI